MGARERRMECVPMIRFRFPVLTMMALTLLAGCGPSAPQATGPGQQVSGRSESRPTPTLVTVVRVEPTSLAAAAITASGAGVGFVTRVFNAGLDLTDAHDRSLPYLAEALPQLNTDSWRVFPDGRMETVYRLKPNLTWQDGTPLATEDFIFGLRVYKTPELGVSASVPLNLIDAIDSPDPRTLVFRWNTLFPGAGALSNIGGSGGSGGFQPLPRHILDAPFREDSPEHFANHAYWSNQYIGLGPYKLERWEPGAFVEGSAFDGHVLGRPKIDRIQVRFMADENIVLANLLSENVHLASDRSIRFEHTQIMQRDWSTNNRGKVLLTISLLRYILMQNRSEIVNPRAMLDLRVRRAIAHSIDKQGMNDGVFDGQATVSDTFVSPDVPFFGDIDRAITKYPYDPRRSEQLMNEAGFVKDRDGLFASASGERFNPLFWEESGSQNEKELNVFIDTWRRAGFDMGTFVLPAVQLRDAQFRATYPAMYTTQGGGSTEDRLDVFASSTIPTPANRYQGNNRGGWSNLEYDRLWDAFNRMLDRTEQNGQVVQMLKIASEEVPAIPIYFNFAPTAHLSTLKGPTLGARIPDARIQWDIHMWEWV
jgi:peptide/nickel transport system substrate-binding protein